MSEKAQAGERQGAAYGGGSGDFFMMPAPYMMADVEVRHPDGGVQSGRIEHNVVCSAGLVHLMNRFFGSVTNSTAGAHLFLHYATVGSGNAWPGISASQVSGYGNNVPLITFASNGTAVSQSASASYTFAHAGTQTVSGVGVHLYTANTLSTNAATAGVLMYCYGTFSNGSLAVQSNGTLNATITLSYGTL